MAIKTSRSESDEHFMKLAVEQAQDTEENDLPEFSLIQAA
jgi:hypothetical protein